MMFVQVAVSSLVVLLAQDCRANEKVFFPGGGPPRITKGVLEIEGYYAESDSSSLMLTNENGYGTRYFNNPPESESRRLSSSRFGNQNEQSGESRFLFNNDNDNNNPLNSNKQQQPFSFFQSFAPVIVSDTATVTRVMPPFCVACTCLQGAQTCQAAGGVELITTTATATGTGTVATVTAPNAIACSTPTAATIVTVSCIVPPPAGLSVCDPSCRANIGQCATNPSAANCPQFTPPPVCSTQCLNQAVGATVRCNAAFPTVISARPASACPNIRKKREPETDLPAIESSIDPTTTGQRRGRLFGLQVARTTLTRTSIIQGTVTATYVAGGNNCLPSNILAAPNC